MVICAHYHLLHKFYHFLCTLSICVQHRIIILDIRKRKFLGERKCEVYKDYNSHPFSSFEKVWLYTNFPEIGQEWKTPSLTRQEYSSKANSGSNNAGAKVTVEDVIEIRKRYDNGEAVRKIWEDYQIITVESVRKIYKR